MNRRLRKARRGRRDSWISVATGGTGPETRSPESRPGEGEDRHQDQRRYGSEFRPGGTPRWAAASSTGRAGVLPARSGRAWLGHVQIDHPNEPSNIKGPAGQEKGRGISGTEPTAFAETVFR